MGFMDKVKAQAEQAVTKGQQAMAQGQTKLDEMQAKKAQDNLLRELGEAYYASQRSGGPTSAVDAAMTALDAHTTATANAAAAASEPSSGGTATEGGSYNLDDV